MRIWGALLGALVSLVGVHGEKRPNLLFLMVDSMVSDRDSITCTWFKTPISLEPHHPAHHLARLTTAAMEGWAVAGPGAPPERAGGAAEREGPGGEGRELHPHLHALAAGAGRPCCLGRPRVAPMFSLRGILKHSNPGQGKHPYSAHHGMLPIGRGTAFGASGLIPHCCVLPGSACPRARPC
jgi:hypothetical protein